MMIRVPEGERYYYIRGSMFKRPLVCVTYDCNDLTDELRIKGNNYFLTRYAAEEGIPEFILNN
jgi:hypothetical protein